MIIRTVRRHILSSSLVQLLIVSFVLAGWVRGQEDPSVEVSDEPIRVKVNLVTLRFSARTTEGAFANHLTPDKFTVFENGERKDIAFFDPPRRDTRDQRPLWLAFLLDVSGSTFATRGEEILAAQSFFDNIYDVTRVGIFGFTDKLLPFQDFTADRQSALRAFAAARAHLGKTALYSSLDALMSQMNERAGPNDRKAVILVSDGMDDEFNRVQATVARARKQGVTVYTVWVPSATQLYIGPAGSARPLQAGRNEKEAAFANLALQTGGKYYGGFETILDFDNVLAEINDELFGNLYSIGYYTDQPYLDHSERQISIHIEDPTLTAHGIFEKSPDRVEAKRRYIAALFDEESLSEVSNSGEAFREIGADLDVLRSRTDQGETSLPFRLKIASFSLLRNEKGGVRTQFGIIGILSDLNGNEVFRLREIFRAQIDSKDLRDGRGVIYTNRVTAPPGDYFLKVVLLEIPSWRMTVLGRTVRIIATN